MFCGFFIREFFFFVGIEVVSIGVYLLRKFLLFSDGCMCWVYFFKEKIVDYMNIYGVDVIC